MENSQIPVTQKSNHVSSVLLYGIPIVSLYIEGQERLCLAQISNTLLKQFSYNEIHNRRVALGITCVQCTPVQLEILRRAGAMPVSSRRCGMITRREAERLCKSFLGDNTPPRLPDDFAFNVQHKCAWGCRGSFLPSRYNSSRAKCIKCNYCGMFFSPNKFIFHSHRLTTNDRYIQPDAANFNSWRRHMTLCGHAQEEKIVHAWEDVKAMFNGGTRKRLVGCNHNNNHNQSSQNSPSASRTTTTNVVDSSSVASECEDGTKRLSLPEETPCSNRLKSIDHQYNYSTVAAAAAVVGVTAVATTLQSVPFNLHHRSTVLSPLQSLRNEHDLSIMPLSRNFVVDYTMWQQQQQQQQQQHNHSKIKMCNSNESIPWIRSEVNASPFNSSIIKNESQHPQSFKNKKVSDAINNNNSTTDFNIPSILSSSAFKPVVASTAIVSTSLYASRSNDSSNCNNLYISPTQSCKSTRTTAVFTNNTITAGQRLPSVGAIFHNSAPSGFSPILDSIPLCAETELSDNNNPTISVDNKNGSSCSIYDGNTGSIIKNDTVGVADNEDDDDDEVVDIETTEDENQNEAMNVDDVAFNVVCTHSPDYISSLSAGHSHSGSPNVDVDVDGYTTDADAEDQFDLKANICSYDINITRSNIKLNLSHEKDTITSNATNEDDEIRQNNFKHRIEDTNGHLKRLSRRIISNSAKERHNLKKNGKVSKLDTDNLFLTQPSLHIQQHVTFPVFLKTHLNSLRQRHHRQIEPSPTMPRQFYCCDTSAKTNDNGGESLNI